MTADRKSKVQQKLMLEHSFYICFQGCNIFFKIWVIVFITRIHLTHVSASVPPPILKIGKEVMEYFLLHFPSINW